MNFLSIPGNGPVKPETVELFQVTTRGGGMGGSPPAAGRAGTPAPLIILAGLAAADIQTAQVQQSRRR